MKTLENIAATILIIGALYIFSTMILLMAAYICKVNGV
jgi:hypothetical protein